MERKNDAVAEIGTTFAELEKSLHQRKGLLVRDLEALCGAKQKVGRGRGGATRCSFLEWILSHPSLLPFLPRALPAWGPQVYQSHLASPQPPFLHWS